MKLAAVALAEVLLGVPAAHVVVHRNPRVPLRDLIQPAAGELFPAHAVRPVLGHLEAVCQLELRPPAGRERPVQVHAPHGAVLRAGERDPSGRLAYTPDRPDVFDPIAALESATRE